MTKIVSTDPDELLASARRKRRPSATPTAATTVVLLDVDQCACVGEDANDILTVCVEMLRSYATGNSPKLPGAQRSLLHMAELIINPAVPLMLKAHSERHKSYPYVALYTAKASIVKDVEVAAHGRLREVICGSSLSLSLSFSLCLSVG